MLSDRKSSLPQRSSSLRRRGSQTQETRLRQVGPLSQRQQQQDTGVTARSRGLLQSDDTRRHSIANSPLSLTRIPGVATPTSPLKQTLTSPTVVPSSPQKSEMPPPPLPQRSASLLRSSSVKVATPGGSKGHVRRRSQVLGGGVVTASQAAKPVETASSSIARPPKPQFSTFQQHFSPRKAVKTPTPATSNSVNSDSLIPSSQPNVAALQTELLQLCLLHSSSAKKDAEWRTKSERELQKKYNFIAGDYCSLVQREKEAQRRINLQALEHWSANVGKNIGRSSFAEQIQSFSKLIQEVADLTEPHRGRYVQVTRVFEDWFNRVEEILQSRKKGNCSEQDITIGMQELVEPLDREWKGEILVLNTKLELCLRDLQSLDIWVNDESLENIQESSLLRIAHSHRALLTSMTEELNAMRAIEAEVVRLERSWTTDVVDRLKPRDVTDATQRTGLWKRL